MQEYTYIVVVLDASGSMNLIKDDAIGGLNTFVEEQRKDNENDIMTLATFNRKRDVVYQNKKLKDVELLTRENYKPMGGTALYDAVGTTIDEVGEELNKMDETMRPKNVIFVIQTDGQENWSKKYTCAQVKEKIEHQKSKYNWKFIYLAADEQGMQDGYNMGMTRDSSFEYAATSKGTAEAFRSASAVTLGMKK